MSPLQDRIPSVGLHMLYEPEKIENTLIDVVFVHGFGGHPMRTWQYDDRAVPSPRVKTVLPVRGRPLKRLLRKTRPPDKTARSTIGGVSTRNDLRHVESTVFSRVFWPRDLLPIACPEARIMTWGYHTLHSGNMPVAAQPDLFAHVNDFLRDLGAHRHSTGVQQRPLIFIAHSLGGIVVKELLREAESSKSRSQRDILSSTAAVIFFGCPHKTVEQVPLADTAVSIAEASLSIKTESSVVSELCGVNNPRWAAAQESFVRLWHYFNFTVKTYQERQSGTNKLAKSCAESSKLGDVREEAESLPADHRGMCQFKSANDVGFKSLSRILQAIVEDEKSKVVYLPRVSVDLDNHQVLGPRSSLTECPIGTCKGICSTGKFRDWYRRQGGSNEHILWLTGALGSGKSTQLRHLKRQMEKQWKSGTTSIIYCTAEGQSHDGIPLSEPKLGKIRSATVIRSVLSQLFAQDRKLRQRLSSLCLDNINDADLTRFFLDDYIMNKPQTLARRTFILVDLEDSCDDADIRELLYCFCEMARNSSFSICLASRPISDDVLANITKLELEKHNFEEIVQLVQSRLQVYGEEWSGPAKKIGEKAGGSFLWAQTATNILNEVIDGGGARDLADKILGEPPPDLYGLYELTLGTLSSKEKADATTIMRWVMLSPEPMMVNDLQMAVRLGRTRYLLLRDPETALDVGLPWSMQELQRTGKQFDTPSQFYQWLCSQTRGLLEARPVNDEVKAQQTLGLQHVYPINESVRSFFLSGRGFAALSSGRATTTSCDDEAVHLCHYSLLRTILMYLNTSDLSPLVSGHRLRESKHGVLSLQKSPTWRRNVVDQRNLITSSYPLLRYAVDNLLYHLLSPRPVRYFLPQHAIFNMFTSNNCRIWLRWTALLGETDASAILARCRSAGELLQPEFGASFRLERVFRAVNKMATGDSWFSPQRSLRLSVFPFPVPPMAQRAKADGDEATQQIPVMLYPPSPPPSPRTIRRGPRSRGTVIVGLSRR
ncbi:hypothetical protein GGR55DRAFT_700171 [Xylaria sp. FL0064]|nr:hypothetical protein GGR55DRAFT_700171 [Xylaria sp. FL0064]